MLRYGTHADRQMTCTEKHASSKTAYSIGAGILRDRRWHMRFNSTSLFAYRMFVRPPEPDCRTIVGRSFVLPLYFVCQPSSNIRDGLAAPYQKYISGWFLGLAVLDRMTLDILQTFKFKGSKVKVKFTALCNDGKNVLNRQ